LNKVYGEVMRGTKSNRYLEYVFANKKVRISIIRDENLLDSKPRFNKIGKKPKHFRFSVAHSDTNNKLIQYG